MTTSLIANASRLPVVVDLAQFGVRLPAVVELRRVHSESRASET
jgi:hypothetical protein